MTSKTLDVIFVAYITACVTIMMFAWCWRMDARIELLEAQNQLVVIENKFLGRKVGEAYWTCIEEDRKRDLSLQLAVSGFRTGHWWAYDSFVREARHNRVAEAGGFYVP